MVECNESQLKKMLYVSCNINSNIRGLAVSLSISVRASVIGETRAKLYGFYWIVFYFNNS